MKKERFFITGGFGYIGAEFARIALEKGHDVCLYDSLMYEQNVNRMLPEITVKQAPGTEIKVVIGDTRNRALLTSSIKDFKPTYVMHWAELSGVYACNHNPIFTEDINYNGSRQVIDVCEELGLPVFYNSSSSVYGAQPKMELMKEDSPLPKPTDYYCRNKLKMEEYIKEKVAKNPNFKIIVFRPATVFGLSPRFRIELLPNHFTYMALSQRLIRVSELNAYRAAIDLEELVNGYFKVIEKGKWNHLIYNIGHHNISKMDFALSIQKVTGTKIGSAPDIGDLRNLQIDSSLLENEFDFHPSIPFDQSIKKVATWITANLEKMEQNNFAELLTMPLDRWYQITK